MVVILGKAFLECLEAKVIFVERLVTTAFLPPVMRSRSLCEQSGVPAGPAGVRADPVLEDAPGPSESPSPEVCAL